MSEDPRYAHRTDKAKKILRILRDVCAEYPWGCVVDLGCGDGQIASALKPFATQMIGIEVDPARFFANRTALSEGVNFAVMDGVRVGLPSESVDLVVLAQVYEHAPDPEGVIEEVWRILKPGGVCFFSGPNKWAIMEEHYWLPFLSWLPKTLANKYMQIMRRGEIYDIGPRSFGAVCKLLGKFNVHDQNMAILRDPGRYDMSLGRMAWISALPAWVLRIGLNWIPNFNIVAIKPK